MLARFNQKRCKGHTKDHKEFWDSLFHYFSTQFKHSSGAKANRKWRELQSYLGAWGLRHLPKKAEVIISGLFFFGYFLLEEQKKVTINKNKKRVSLLRHPLFVVWSSWAPLYGARLPPRTLPRSGMLYRFEISWAMYCFDLRPFINRSLANASSLVW